MLRAVVVMDKGVGLMVILKAALLVAPLASVTWAVKSAVPPAVGVPLIAPVEVFSCRPMGKLPVLMDQVKGGVPPLAANAAL